jgi:hypothetical protein
MPNAKSSRTTARSVLKTSAGRLTNSSMSESPKCKSSKDLYHFCTPAEGVRTKSQKTLWDRLDVLNKKRQSLETAILTSMKTVEVHTSNITSELNAMFDGRIDELEEPSTPEE